MKKLETNTTRILSGASDLYNEIATEFNARTQALLRAGYAREEAALVAFVAAQMVLRHWEPQARAMMPDRATWDVIRDLHEQLQTRKTELPCTAKA